MHVRSRTLHLLHLSIHHFRAPSFHGSASCDFSRFCLVFTVFMHIWHHPLRVLRFDFVFYLGQLILWILLTWTNTHWWGFRIYISQHHFCIPLKLWNLSFALDLRFQNSKVRVFDFWCSVSDLKCLIAPFSMFS